MTLSEEAQKKILELEAQVNHLKDQLAIAEKNAAIDALTGVFNRRVLEKELRTNLADADRNYFDLVIVEIDLDHFKEVNDTWGHLHGDKVLRDFTEIIQATLRDTDIFGRWGGEEFLLVLPVLRGTPLDQIEDFIKRLHLNTSKINRSDNPHREPEPLTISSGAIIVEAGHNKIDYQQVLRQVDAALYESKKSRDTHTIKFYQEGYLESPQ